MTFNPKVSIIIPVYNGANYLREAIDSALAQTYKNVEVIVVNDGSDDGGKTEAIARSYGDSIRYFPKENGGVATALNLGIQKAEGHYISWLSHDDLYLPNKLEVQVDFIGKDNASDSTILYSDYKALDLRHNSSHVIKIDHVDPCNYIYDILYLLFGGAIHGCTLLLPKACFDDVGLFSEKLKTVQDYELWFRLARNQYEFRHVPEVLIVTRWHEEQGTHTMSDIHKQEVEELYCWAFDQFNENLKSFSFEQIARIIMLLRNEALKRSSAHLIKSWSRNRLSRSILSYIERKPGEHPLLMKLASVGDVSLAKIHSTLKRR